MESSKFNEDQYCSSWAEEVEIMQEEEELRASQSNVDQMIDEGMTNDEVSMKDHLEPSTPRTSSSEQTSSARAEEEPSVPPSGPRERASLDGIGKQELKKGEKLLTMEDLLPYVQSSPLAISISYVETDIEAPNTNYVGPWIYKNKKMFGFNIVLVLLAPLMKRPTKYCFKTCYLVDFPKRE